MFADSIGLLLTLLTIAAAVLSGATGATVLLGSEEKRNRISFCAATLLLAISLPVFIATVLGALGVLHFHLAFAVLVLPAAAGWWFGVLRFDAVRDLVDAAGRRILSSPASVVAALAVASESLRGLLLPPLSWDSLTYHSYFAASWLQSADLAPVSGRFPTRFHTFWPSNGSLWFWWWLAPSHSELYLSLANLLPMLLLTVVVVGVARELGAKRNAILAAALVVTMPTVLRLVATQYVDLLAGAAIVAGCFFGLRWMRTAQLSDALLTGFAVGLAAGTKLLALPFGVVLAACLVVAAPIAARARLRHIALGLLCFVAMGGFFYLRNIALGLGPFAMECSRPPVEIEPGLGSRFFSASSVVARLPELLQQGLLTDTVLGSDAAELGAGPAALLLALALAVPLSLRRSISWPVLFVVGTQVIAEIVIWVVVPDARDRQILFNLRYLIPALGLLAALFAAALESLTVSERVLDTLGLAIVALSASNAISPILRAQRIAVAVSVGVAALLLFSSVLRPQMLVGRRAIAALFVIAALVAAPHFAAWRLETRGASYRDAVLLHPTTARYFAGAWGWLDKYGGDGAVAVSTEPGNYFMYPAMGMRLERRSIYVNVNAADHATPDRYGGCEPRVDLTASAWLQNLEKREVRWLLFGRYPATAFPLEARWAAALPDIFHLRHSDETSQVYERRAAQERP